MSARTFERESPEWFAAKASADLIAAIEAAIAAVEGKSWPEVEVTRKGHLRCPYCRAKDRFVEQDYGRRENDCEVEVRESGTYVYVAQGDQDFHTLAFQCTACTGLVSFPGEVEVDWS